jgi:hypothetical protein
MPMQRGARYLLLVKELKNRSQGFDNFNKEELAQVERMIEDCLSIFSSAKNTQTSTYQFGDYTRYFMHKFLNSNQESNPESKKESVPAKVIDNTAASSSVYHFGDITRGILRRMSKKTEPTTTTDQSVATSTTKSENTPKEVKSDKSEAEKAIVSKTLKDVPPAYKLGALMNQSIWEANAQKKNNGDGSVENTPGV